MPTKVYAVNALGCSLSAKCQVAMVTNSKLIKLCAHVRVGTFQSITQH